MDTLHTQTAGDRTLNPGELAMVSQVKALAAQVGALVQSLRRQLPEFTPDSEPIVVDGHALMGVSVEAFETDRWINVAQDHLQQGFMALERAVVRPDTF